MVIDSPLRAIQPRFTRVTVPLTARTRYHVLLRRQFVLAARSIGLAEHLEQPPPDISEEARACGSEDGAFIEFCPQDQVRTGITLTRPLFRYTPYLYDRFFVDTREGWDGYNRRLAVRKRSAIQRKVRRLVSEAGHAVDCRTYSSGQDIETFFSWARTIGARRAGWAPRLLPDTPAFRRIAATEAEARRLRAYVLFFREIPISYLFCPIVEGALIYDHLAYDAAFGHLSPGFMLLWCVIQDAFAQPHVRYIDFTQGSGQQKRFFANGHLRCGDAFFLRASPGHLLTVASHRLLNAIGYSAERHLRL